MNTLSNPLYEIVVTVFVLVSWISLIVNYKKLDLKMFLFFICSYLMLFYLWYMYALAYHHKTKVERTITYEDHVYLVFSNNSVIHSESCPCKTFLKKEDDK